ncbi:MAG TPA: hypothetical protein PLA94_11840, partial [Myxococcota bacterium]|nr:hypothetical protein [Myxococcota bacterium]
MTMRYAHLAPGDSQPFFSLLDDVSANTFSSEFWHTPACLWRSKKEKMALERHFSVWTRRDEGQN